MIENFISPKFSPKSVGVVANLITLIRRTLNFHKIDDFMSFNDLMYSVLAELEAGYVMDLGTVKVTLLK